MYLARKDVFADAVAAGSLTDGPVLLVPTCGAVPAIVVDEVARLSPSRVVALGGTGAVCGQVLADAAGGRSTTRLAGSDRYLTSLEIAKERAKQGPISEIYLANGDDRPDAVVGGQLTRGPILLMTTTKDVTSAFTSFVDLRNPKRVVALGGSDVVPQPQLDALATGRLQGRLAGASRYVTAAAIASRQFPQDADTVYLARGDVYADAVAGGSLTEGPVLLVGQCSLPQAARERIAAARPLQIVALGSSGAVCDDVLAKATQATTVSGGRFSLVNVDETGWPVDEVPWSAAFSDEPRYLVWSGWRGASLNKPATDGVFLRDFVTGTDTRVDLPPPGEALSGVGHDATVSRDGRFVAFDADASPLVNGHGIRSVYVRDLQMGVTKRLTVGTGGEMPNGSSFYPRISADGSTVAFASVATSLVVGDSNGVVDVFAAAVSTGAVSLISRGVDSSPGNGASTLPAVSADGRFVAFRTAATNIVAGDTDSATDIAVTDRDTGSTEYASVTTAGDPMTTDAGSPSISEDGARVAFISAVDGTSRLWLRDRTLATTEIVSRDVGGQPVGAIGGVLSGDGQHVVFGPGSTFGDASEWYARDLSTGQVTWLTAGFGGQALGSPTIFRGMSRDATRIAFTSQSDGLYEMSSTAYTPLRIWSKLVPR